MMDEAWLHLLLGFRKGHPGLNAVHPPAALPDGRSNRSEWLMPLPAVIQFTAPGRMACCAPVLSRCMISPSNRYVTVESPICG